MNINNESAGHQRSLRNNLGATRAAIVALVAVLVTVGLATPAQAAVNFWASVIVGQGVSYVNVRSAPSTTSTILRTIASGQRVGLDCYVTGQAVTGPYGTSSIWYRIDSSLGGGYVTDSYLETGSNSAVTPSCTSGTLSSKVDAFVTKYNNKYVDYDGRYGAQCVDLFNFYNRDVIGAGFIGVSYAHQLYNAAPTTKYQKLSAAATPRKGDVAVWSSSKPYSGGAGHVAIVLANVSSTSISVFEQNVSGSPSIVRNESKSYLLGYLRPIT